MVSAWKNPGGELANSWEARIEIWGLRVVAHPVLPGKVREIERASFY